MSDSEGNFADGKQNMREWRNWQTRTFEGRVVHTVRVQVPFLAKQKGTLLRSFFVLEETDRVAEPRIAVRLRSKSRTSRNSAVSLCETRGS